MNKLMNHTYYYKPVVKVFQRRVDEVLILFMKLQIKLFLCDQKNDLDNSKKKKLPILIPFVLVHSYG